jgi:hypothetical protein
MCAGHVFTGIDSRAVSTEASRQALAELSTNCRDSVERTSTVQESYLASFKKAAEVLDQSVVAINDGMAVWTGEQNSHLLELQQDVAKYVDDDLKRDTKPEPARKKYEYPTTFAKTQAYRGLLSGDDKLDWDREGRMLRKPCSALRCSVFHRSPGFV